MNAESLVNWDPFPPLDGIEKYVMNQKQPGRLQIDSTGLAFLHSLLPSFIADWYPSSNEENDAEGAVGGTGLMEQQLVSLIEATRNLLSNIRFTEVLNNDADIDEDASDN